MFLVFTFLRGVPSLSLAGVGGCIDGNCSQREIISQFIQSSRLGNQVNLTL